MLPQQLMLKFKIPKLVILAVKGRVLSSSLLKGPLRKTLRKYKSQFQLHMSIKEDKHTRSQTKRTVKLARKSETPTPSPRLTYPIL